MLRVFICDDDANFLASVKKCAENYILMENLPMPIVCAATSPHDIHEYLEINDRATGLYFLDYHLNSNINGVQLAEIIRTYDPWGVIVFITSDGDSHATTFEYGVEAMGYIVKGEKNIEEHIIKYVTNAYAKFISNDVAMIDKFTIKITRDASPLSGSTYAPSKDSTIVVDYRTIMYFETMQEIKHNITMYTSQIQTQFRGSLSNIEKDLDMRRFYRLQRNIIVNLESITSVDGVKLTVTFANGMVIELPPNQVGKLSRLVRDASNGMDKQKKIWGGGIFKKTLAWFR